MNQQDSEFQDGPVVSPGGEFGSQNTYSNQGTEEVIGTEDPSVDIYHEKDTPQNAAPIEMAFDNENSQMQGNDSSVEFVGTTSVGAAFAAVPDLYHPQDAPVNNQQDEDQPMINEEEKEEQ